MRTLFERTKQVHMAMMEKTKGVLQQKDDMRMQMEEAFRAQEAVSAEANLLSCLPLLSGKRCRPYVANLI